MYDIYQDAYNFSWWFFIAFLVAAPLALWKAVDIVLWLIRNVQITIGG